MVDEKPKAHEAKLKSKPEPATNLDKKVPSNKVTNRFEQKKPELKKPIVE